MESQNKYNTKRDEILAILENKELTISEKFDSLQIAELIQDTDIYQAELVAQNQELLEKETQILTSRIEFETLFNFAPIAYFKLDKQYNIIKYNLKASDFFNSLNLRSYVNKPFSLLLKAGEALDFINFQNKLITNDTSQGVFHFYSADDLIGRVDIKKYNDSFFLSIIDVTNEKKQEAMILAQAKNAAMGEMLSMITHQWKQPLSVISILGGIIEFELENQESLDREKLLSYNFQIKNQIVLMSDTIDDFKEYFSPNKQIEIQNVQDCIERAKKFTYYALSKNDIELSINFLDDCDYEFLAFKHDVCQVLINILNNAKDEFLKSKKESNKSIILDVFHKDENIILNITNNGGHIPNDMLNLLFHKDFTTKKESGGSGIGLYIVEMIVKEHLHGTISVKNIDDGESVLFTLTIPVAKHNKE